MRIQKSFRNEEGVLIPYYEFNYYKDFASIIKVKKNKYKRQYYFDDGTYLPEFIADETIKQFDFNEDYVVFEKAMFVIVHAFASYDLLSDVDNYSYKPFIDTIRKLRIIEDDTWQKANITNIGIFSEEERIDLYVVPFQHYPSFLDDKLWYLFIDDYEIMSLSEKEQTEKEVQEFF